MRIGGKNQADEGLSRKHRSDVAILLTTFALMAMGLIIIYAISPLRAKVLNAAYGADNYAPNYFFLGQLRSVVLATVAFLIAFLVVPYEKIGRMAKGLILAGLILSFAMWLMSFGGVARTSLVRCELGACRWLVAGGVSFQPAEFLKLGLVIYLASLISRKRKGGTMGSLQEFWLPVGVVSLIALFFVVVIQKDLGTGLSMAAIIMSILFVGGVKLKQYFIMLVLVLVAGVLMVVAFPHRMERLNTFLGGGDRDESYHVDNAMLAIGTGGMWGVGIGNSVQATGYLPESINDSVFAVMGETFGFCGLFFVVMIFAILLMRILKVAERMENLERKLVAVGVFAWLFTHIVVNIAAMTGLVPVTGITLPLLSYGGTSMIFVAFSIGLVSQLSCYTGREVKDENTSSGRGVRRTYYPSRRRRS